MSKIAALVVALLLPGLASAACTYDAPTNGSTRVATCSASTEAAPTLVTEGLNLAGKSGLTVVVSAATPMTAGGTLKAYLWCAGCDSGAGAWVRAPDLDLTVQALAAQSFPGFVVTVPQGRIEYRPNGVGLATTIYLVGQ